MEHITTTTVLCSNIHCPSCVKTVKESLKEFGDAIIEHTTSTVTQTVIVKHKDTVSVQQLARALYDAGFDVQSLWEQRGHSRASLFPLAWLSPGADVSKPTKLSEAFQEFSCGLLQSPEQSHAHREMHSKYCDQCNKGQDRGRVDSLARLTANASQCGDHEDTLAVVVSEAQRQPELRVVLALEGMTCSACVGRVTEVLEARPLVNRVNVNLIGQSATLVVDHAEKLQELVDEIEDIGYEATLESCEPIVDTAKDSAITQSKQEQKAETRTITIHIPDMYCDHCPNKISYALSHCGRQIKLLNQLTYPAALLTIEYAPQAPQFTIRDILATIRQADPQFQPRIFQPPSLEERAIKLQRTHRQYLLGRLILAVFAAIPTFIWGVVIMSLLPTDSPTREFWMNHWFDDRVQAVQIPLLILATVVYFFCAEVFHRRALKELYMMWRPQSRVPILRRFYRFGSMDMLLSLGTTVAYLGSIIVMIVAGSERAHPTDNMTGGMDTTTYFDAVVFLTMFLLMGRLLEAYGKAKTADAVSALSGLKAKDALLLTKQLAKSEDGVNYSTQRVPLLELEVGDVVVVPAGTAPPCDGKIVFGISSFDESSLTGESQAVSKGIGDMAFAGTINLTNVVQLQITATAGTTMLDGIIDTVREGQAKRAPIERFADLLTGYFVPLVVLIAVCDWVIWMLLGYGGIVSGVNVGAGGWAFWSLQFAIAVLVVACPCGIGLAAPTALFVGTGLAAKRGILVKGGGEAFQEASELDCVIFDKTGTLTQGGAPRITDQTWLESTDNELIRLAILQLESGSTHPLAAGVVNWCGRSEVGLDVSMSEAQEIPGMGMKGCFAIGDESFELFIGNDRLAQQHEVFMTSIVVETYRGWTAQAKTVVFVGIKHAGHDKWRLAAMLAAWDPVRAESASVIKALQNRQIDVWLLSGDNARTAQAVASTVGIPTDHVIAGVLPQQKAEKVQLLQRSASHKHSGRRARVAMVGDGINDAPALAMADVGIAMGSGSDTAISSADFVLLSSDLNAVLSLVRLSKVVLRRVKFNFAWALGYNLIMLPFAAGVLYPVVSNGSHVRLDPVWASLAMALSSISVVLSSLLLKTRLPVLGFRDS